MEFVKQRDATDTTYFCPRQLVTDLLRGKWRNGFWRYATHIDQYSDIITVAVSQTLSLHFSLLTAPGNRLSMTSLLMTTRTVLQRQQ